jgi:hypothetical protein
MKALVQQALVIAREALERVFELTGSLQPTTKGTQGAQTGNVDSFQLFASTSNAGTVTVDTGYKPPPGHSAKVDGGFNVVDRTANTTTSKNTNASFYNNAGTVAAHGAPSIGGTVGDAPLATATIAFAISGTNTVEVTFTPPGGYVGDLDWVYNLTFSEN